MANRWGNSGNSERLYFGGAPKSLQMVTAAMKLKDACSLEEKPSPTPRDYLFTNRWGNNGNSDRLFWGAPKSLQTVTAALKLKDACSLEEKL